MKMMSSVGMLPTKSQIQQETIRTSIPHNKRNRDCVHSMDQEYPLTRPSPGTNTTIYPLVFTPVRRGPPKTESQRPCIFFLFSMWRRFCNKDDKTLNVILNKWSTTWILQIPHQHLSLHPIFFWILQIPHQHLSLRHILFWNHSYIVLDAKYGNQV